ncbi:MAG: UDP-N-acetylmuramoyl-L-alanyl-D-glutamate--L-lysine ligase [Streptococcaceae bacterium]|nr:UDP-N-acetylmuramoyl-L-alanyl-D-glutamate--L-lysine ligase [Streptococcaceae bacterium]
MITFSEILSALTEDDNLAAADLTLDCAFDSLSYDSRTLTDTTLFFAKGSGFKKEFLEQMTAPVYVSETDYGISARPILVKNVQRAMSKIAMAFYNHPEKKLKLLAFTGTKGKTTSAYFAKAILDEMNGGKTALLSTAYTILDGKTAVKSALTTPESLDLLAMMAAAVVNGMTHLVMEVSSQAYLLGRERVAGLTFDVGVWLNIFPDHIGPAEHPDFENYFACKRQLLYNSRFAIVNAESARFEALSAQVANLPHIFYGAHTKNELTHSGKFDFTTNGRVSGDFHINLLGRFNQENALAASLATQQLGATIVQIRAGISKTVVPGRMEILEMPHGSTVYIDYAHNGVSLENLVKVVEPHHSGKLILVLGATGNKGESRRRGFGEVIERHTRLDVLLTTDDSNFEAPEKIAQEIMQFISRPVGFEKDRATAIRQALSRLTGENDALIIAGKGEDHFQLLNGKREPYLGDREVVEKTLI